MGHRPTPSTESPTTYFTDLCLRLAVNWQSPVSRLVHILLSSFFVELNQPPQTALSHLSDSSMSLPQLISTSRITKARLLHYFAPDPGSAMLSDDEPVDSWCGFHLDHSLLTGLCSVRTPIDFNWGHSFDLSGHVPLRG